MLPIKQVRGFGHVTANAGTAFTRLIPPAKGLTAVLTSLDYTHSNSTVHDITVLPAVWETTVAAAAIPTATALVLTEDKGTGSVIGAPASGDIVCIEHTDGTFSVNTLTGWTAGTLTAAVASLPKAVAAGAKIWFFGAVADHAAARIIKFPASARNKLSDGVAGLFSGEMRGGPMLIHSPNGTHAGTINHAAVAYCDFGRK